MRPIVLLLAGVLLALAFTASHGVVPAPPPISGDGLSVLIVEETSATFELPASQQEILHSYGETSVRRWLRDHKADWRVWDQHVDAAHESAKWQAAIALPRQSVPWLIVSNGRIGWSGPLPMTTQETLKILEDYVE